MYIRRVVRSPIPNDYFLNLYNREANFFIIIIIEPLDTRSVIKRPAMSNKWSGDDGLRKKAVRRKTIRNWFRNVSPNRARQ